MMTDQMQQKAKEVVKKFFSGGCVGEPETFGSGHINNTFLIRVMEAGEEKKYILQNINTAIFPKPEELMENIGSVTAHLRNKIIANGGDPERETLNIVPTLDQKPYYQDTDGSCYRIYKFIGEAVCYDLVEKPQDFYQSGLAFGNFQRLLSDFPAETLKETIPQFHDTWKRYGDFKKAVEKDSLGRVKEVEKEIEFVQKHEELAKILGELQRNGTLPLRVTHNDTKLNNIMIDKKTGTGLCVIDLDTVMPGLAANDFGDSIRFGANTSYEDETDLSKVSCSLELFEAYTKGFLEGVNGSLTKAEIEALPLGAMVMTFECGMRFLTDYLEGDVYFKIHRKQHNLERCRCQFQLLTDMEQKREELDAIVKNYN